MNPRPLAFTRRTALLAAAGTLAPVLDARAAKAVQPAKPADPAPTAWPIASPVPGGIARLALGPAPTRPQAFAAEVPLLVLGDARGWTAVVGIPLSATPGPAQIVVRTAGGERALGYDIRPKRYVEQRLTVSPRTVDLAPEDLARHERERAHQQQVMETFSEPFPARWTCTCACRRPDAAPAPSGCGASSTASPAPRTAAWTSPRPPARRWWRPCRGG
jgi:hypothetical protein